MFVERKIEEIEINPYTLFAKRWAALSAGNKENGYNAMTIAWGTIGSLWEKGSHSNRLPVMSVYVRPNRYTNGIMNNEDYFTVSFLNEKDKKIFGYLGSHTGKNEDKYTGAGLTPCFEKNSVYPEEAELVFICKKIYKSTLKEEEFIDTEIVPFNYPKRDFHDMFIGQIVAVLEKVK